MLKCKLGKLNLELKALGEDESGMVLVEFAFVSLALLYMLMNGLEVARWYYQRTEVSHAIHSASQAVLRSCDPTKQLPATTNCPNFNTYVAEGLASTALGNSIVLTSGFPTEAYYCLNSSKTLQQVGTTASARPSDCTAVGDSTHRPGDYVQIQASYTFSPLFTGLTAGSLMPTNMTSTGFIRLL